MTAARKPGRHAASRRRPIRLAWLWLLAGLAGLWAALARVGDEDEGWTDGELAELNGRKQFGPQPPARRPRVSVAFLRGAALIRATPVDAIPWLQHGAGFSDTTGTFTKLSQEPPALHADESVSMTRADLDAGLAEHVKDWTP